MIGPVLDRPLVSSRPRTLVVAIDPPEVVATLIAPTGAVIGTAVRATLADDAEPAQVLPAIWTLAEELGELDRVTVGFPGAVVGGVTHRAAGLGPAWDGFDLAAALQQQSLRPARVVDDADLVAHAAIAGVGVELVVTIGARFAAKLLLDGKPLPGFALGAHRFRKKATYADYIAGDAFAKHGRKKWNARVRKVIASLLATFAPTRLYVGGRDARFIYGELPPNVEVLGPPSLAAALWLWE
jgi:polyphosphate glucokinase